MNNFNINNYFDKIIVVNLDRRKDRWNKIEKQFKELNITNYLRVSAIDPTQSENNIKIPSNFYDTPGAYGMLCSARKVLLIAKRNNYKRILLLEDDIIFHNKFNKLFEQKTKNIPNNWLLYYLGTSLHNWRIKERCNIKEHYMHAQGTIAGAFAVGIDHRVYDMLLYYATFGNLSWDIGPLTLVNKKYLINSIIVQPYLVIADTRNSDIREAKNLKIKASKCNWKLENFNYCY